MALPASSALFTCSAKACKAYAAHALYERSLKVRVKLEVASVVGIHLRQAVRGIIAPLAPFVFIMHSNPLTVLV